jgi:hypothetical protein
MGFNKVPLLILYPLLNLSLRWEPTGHYLMKIIVLETEPFVGTGADPRFTPRAHQQALTTVPFDNTCEEDVVSPKAAMRVCGIEMSPTKGISSGSNTTTRKHSYIPHQDGSISSCLHSQLADLLSSSLFLSPSYALSSRA